jgi:RNA polymerase sigma factor (sigma-70 family)
MTRLLSDDRLAQRATQGDRRAFEAIYRRYHQDLYRFCLAMVGNPQDAQDALQNTMVKVLRALPGEERKIQLKPWLYRIARNEAVETLRRRRDSAALEPELTAPGGEIAQTAEDRERLRGLLADLEQLPTRQRAALVMRELAGLDFAQIGEAFSSSAAVARQTLYEARLSLRQMEEGREMRCEAVTRELSDADGRVTRRRQIRAHLRDCAGCRAFRDEIAARRGELAAIAPLPLVASAGLLHGILGAQANAAAGAGGAGATAGATGGGGLTGTIGAGAGKAVATSAIVKSVATVSIAAVVGVSAADRSGLIDLPLPARSDPSAQSAPEPHGPPAGSGAAGAVGAAVSRNPAASDGREGKSVSHGRRGEGGRHMGDGTGSKARGNAARPDRSQAGLIPPGGGHGRSASARHGRPDALPAASVHGQGTATAHKSAHAASSPGHSVAHRGHGKSGGRSSPPHKPAPPPKAKAPAASPSQPPAKAPSQGDHGPAEPVGGDTPPTPEP